MERRKSQSHELYMHRNILGKVGEQRAEEMKVILRTILLDWVNRKRIRRKRELTIMQYRQGTNPHTFLSVVDLDCCWIKWERIDRTPWSCFSFVLRLCGVCEWTGPQGTSQRYLWSEQLLGGTKTGSTTTIHWYNYYYYLLPNMKLFKIIDLFVCLFFDSRLLGAQTSKGKLKKPLVPLSTGETKRKWKQNPNHYVWNSPTFVHAWKHMFRFHL